MEEVIKVEKKRRILPRIIGGFFIILLIILLAIAGFVAYCSLDKKQSLSVFPHEYTAYLHVDSAWDTVEPLLDLKAMDMFLSSPELTGVRGMFMQLRASEWRKNRFLAMLASKSIDGAVYKNEADKYNFIITIDLGSLSFVSRIFPFVYEKLNVKGLYREREHFIFDSNGAYYYIKPYKNLIVVCDNPELLELAFEQDYNSYTVDELKLFEEKTEAPVKIIANISKLLSSSEDSNEIITEGNKSVADNALSLISVNITDENINLEAKIPLSVPEASDYLLGNVLNKRSTTPSILSRFRENVQYYTILNAGTLEELKAAFLPLVIEDSDKLWKKCDGLSKSLIGISIDDLLFSWTGNEVAMFGLVDKNDPVFAIQVKDEKQRQKIFEKLTSSMLIKNNASLILDGVRIPRLELPVFLQDLLKLFEVTLPHPYYYIQDGFIYFSESADNLCDIVNSEGRLEKIGQEMNWKTISKGLSSDSTISLYYNLQRSIPFFLKSKAGVSNILSLYQIGRADITLKNKQAILKLSAISKGADIGNGIPGFPVSLNGTVDGNLIIETTDEKAKSTALYWVENKKTIVSMEIPSTSINRYELQDEVFISENDGKLWAVTSHGEIYLFNRKLEVEDGFPKIIGENITIPPATGSDGLYIVTEDGHLYWMDKQGNQSERYLDIFGSIKASPYICSDKKGNRYIGIYDKSFFGKVIIIMEGAKNDIYYYDLPGIAYGSPAFLFNPDFELPYVSLITQNGDLHIWNMNTDEEKVIQLNGLFKIAPVSIENYFFAVAIDGTVYRVDLNGEILDVKIPDVTCNEAFVTVNKDKLFICPDGNIIYGFDTNLEVIYPFPVTGWGKPVFADVNGDNIPDCFRLSIDNKLHATKIK